MSPLIVGVRVPAEVYEGGELRPQSGQQQPLELTPRVGRAVDETDPLGGLAQSLGVGAQEPPRAAVVLAGH